MGLIDQALPLSNFYLKVRLLQGVTDEVFCNKVRACNRAIGDRLFHSVYTGMETLSLDPNQRPKKTPTMPDHNTEVVDGLPFYITLKDVRDWLTRVSQTPNAKVDWGEARRNLCCCDPHLLRLRLTTHHDHSTREALPDQTLQSLTSTHLQDLWDRGSGPSKFRTVPGKLFL